MFCTNILKNTLLPLQNCHTDGKCVGNTSDPPHFAVHFIVTFAPPVHFRSWLVGVQYASSNHEKNTVVIAVARKAQNQQNIQFEKDPLLHPFVLRLKISSFPHSTQKHWAAHHHYINGTIPRHQTLTNITEEGPRANATWAKRRDKTPQQKPKLDPIRYYLVYMELCNRLS